MTTRGQFDVSPRWRTTIAMDFVGNPVAKDGVAPKNPELHLTAYTIEPPIPSVPEPVRRVVFSNQFGPRFEWQLAGPQLLLLPAGKTADLIRTADQFIPLLPILQTVLGPTMLAVPSTKLEWNEEN